MNMYQENILEHSRNPSNYGVLDKFTHSVFDSNPLCGDEVSIQLLVDSGIIKKVAFSSVGCVISRAGSSIITEFVIGKSVDDIKKMSKEDMLGILNVELSASRIKCALLGFVALKKSLWGVSDVAD
ncbi:iron-sulfur cluster assembly scaffold protein [Candidatus Woesearchaeota archaeon]|nr:iron-sulfur cluster assembly scaffold protein [Candidatus Woesearchaeota archaeon]